MFIFSRIYEYILYICKHSIYCLTLYICVCVYIYACVCIWVWIYIHTYIKYVYTHIHMHTYVYIYSVHVKYIIICLYCIYAHYICMCLCICMGLPRYCSDKESTCQCRRLTHKWFRFDPWVRKIPWGRKWQATLVFLPGKFHGQRSLLGYSSCDRKELYVTERWSSRMHARARTHTHIYIHTQT